MTTSAPIGLKRFLLEDSHTQSIGAGLASAIDDLAQASRKIAHLVGRGSLGGMHGSAGSENIQGETQKKLDIVSNDVLLEVTTWSEHWAGFASEEMDNAVAIENAIGQGGWLCVFDPLDGSSNIDINGSVGSSLFCRGNCSPRCGGCVSCQGQLNRDQGISAFVGHGLQSAGDTPISHRVFFSTETTTDLLLDFVHAQIALGPVVRERHFGASGEQ